MSRVDRYFRLARKVALKGDTNETSRQYRIGAVGIRVDGPVVMSNNVPSRKPEPKAHAEVRLLRKLDYGSTVFVVRIHRNGKLANARPCEKCQISMRLRGIKYCYYSISELEYGVLKS